MSLITATISTIFIGDQSNDGTGDNIRTAFEKVNANFYNITATNLGVLVDFYNSASYLLSVLTQNAEVTKQYVDASTATAYTLSVSTSKAYVDNLAGLIAENYMPKGGGIMTGSLYLSISPTSSGGTMTLNGIAPQITLNSGTANWINLGGQQGIGAPTYSSHSPGTKLVLWNNIGVSDAGLAIGVESGYMWFGVSNSSNGFKWYAGTDSLATLDGHGTLTAARVTATTAVVTATQASVSSQTGALVVTGGAGIGGDVYVGGGVYSNNSFPAGGIIMWHGSIVTIPAGWYICDGNNGTPDLRDRFIIGAGYSYSPGVTGGSADAVVVSHTHGINDPGHHHSYIETPIDEIAGPNVNANPGVYIGTATNDTGNTFTNITINTVGVSGTNANLPPYYALAYIMKA